METDRDQKGRFIEGNPGKPAGAVTKVSAEVRDILFQAMRGEVDNITEALRLVRQDDPYHYLNVVVKLLGFMLPRAIDVTSDGERITAGINITLGDEGEAKELKRFFNEIQ